MPNYPFVSPQDETSQYLASILQQYKPGSLGNTATIGNPQGQQDYAAQLAQALAEMETSTKQQERASAMQNPEFIQNSGALGVLAVMAQAYAGKKMDEKAGKKYEDASMRAMTAKDVLDEAKAERAAAKALKATQDERKQRGTDADQFGLTPDERKRYVLTGNLPNEVRDRVQAVQGQDGFVAANLDRGTWSRLREEGSQSQQLPPNVNVRYQPDEGVDPEQDRKIFDALVAQDMQRPAPTSMDEHVDAGMVRPQQQGGALMPYKDPAIAQRQAASDARDERRLALTEQSAGDARAARQTVGEMKQQAAKARQDASTLAAQDLIDSIDRVTGSKGYGDLGTMWGDVKTHVPGVRNDAKDAQASLDNIGGQVALSTMATLKSLSAQGATGFGALSKPELDLLKNSIAALQAGNLSHEALDANLKVVRSKMGRITSWQGDGQPSAPAAAPQPGHVLKYNPQTGEFE